MSVKLTREECKQTMLNILDLIAKVCEENNLHYFLAYGTMLGAVRHHGFIPWDDDIDIYLPRKDYEKLLTLMKEESETSNTWIDVKDQTTENYYYPFAKIVDARTVAKMENNLTEHGIWVDVFPVDNSCDNTLLANLQIEECAFLRAIIISMTTDFTADNLGNKRGIKRALRCIAKMVGYKRITNRFIQVSKRYDDSSSDYAMNFFTIYKARDRMKKNILFTEAEYSFEGHTYVGSKYYDEFLSHMYGDYMKMPPENKRRTHSIDAYWKI